MILSMWVKNERVIFKKMFTRKNTSCAILIALGQGGSSKEIKQKQWDEAGKKGN